jgi:hypothetical protein
MVVSMVAPKSKGTLSGSLWDKAHRTLSLEVKAIPPQSLFEAFSIHSLSHPLGIVFLED